MQKYMGSCVTRPVCIEHMHPNNIASNSKTKDTCNLRRRKRLSDRYASDRLYRTFTHPVSAQVPYLKFVCKLSALHEAVGSSKQRTVLHKQLHCFATQKLQNLKNLIVHTVTPCRVHPSGIQDHESNGNGIVFSLIH